MFKLGSRATAVIRSGDSIKEYTGLVVSPEEDGVLVLYVEKAFVYVPGHRSSGRRLPACFTEAFYVDDCAPLLCDE